MIISMSFLLLSLLGNGNTSDGCPSNCCHSWYKKYFLRSLSSKEKYHHQLHILCDALLTGTKSPLYKLYQCYNEQAMITFTGFDERCFDYVLEANIFDAFTSFLDGKITQLEQKTCGWKRMICINDCLGLVLGWTRTHRFMMTLQLILEWPWQNYWCIYALSLVDHWNFQSSSLGGNISSIKRKNQGI